jgi:uncharacterized protein YndB with AHSA1/START domain
MVAAKAGSKDVIVTRIFEAQPERVWKSWSDADQVMRWWGPNSFTSPSCKMDFREGGRTVVCMRSPDGQDFYNTWKYEAIVPFERLEYIQNLSDGDGKMIAPESVGLRADFPRDVRTVVTFKAVGAKTEMTMTEYGFPDSEMFKMAEMGLHQCLDKMAESLKK